MKILIIGNGFDLAHGLPTSYDDFLEFSRIVRQIYSYDKTRAQYLYNEKIKNIRFPQKIKDELLNAITKKDVEHNLYLEEYYERLSNNIWYDYFLKIIDNKLVKGVNWIDFESEIRDIIMFFDSTEVDLSESYQLVYNQIEEISKKFDSKYTEKLNCFNDIISSYKIDDYSVKRLRKRLYLDLRRLTRALEIYISHYVSQIDCSKKKIIEEIKPDHIVSFNYSDTYSRIYDSSIPVTYIHGKAEDNCFLQSDDRYKDSIDSCKLVLGIDEYLESDYDKMKQVKYTIFKKYAQRIVFNTGKENNLWLTKMTESFEKLKRNMTNEKMIYDSAYSSVSIFGHSLDVTDKDILSRYIGAPYTDVKVFCKDIEAEGELLANTVSLIGEQTMIDKVYKEMPSLKYEIVQD
jgi:hypothetical protein